MSVPSTTAAAPPPPTIAGSPAPLSPVAETPPRAAEATAEPVAPGAAAVSEPVAPVATGGPATGEETLEEQKARLTAKVKDLKTKNKAGMEMPGMEMPGMGMSGMGMLGMGMGMGQDASFSGQKSQDEKKNDTEKDAKIKSEIDAINKNADDQNAKLSARYEDEKHKCRTTTDSKEKQKCKNEMDKISVSIDEVYTEYITELQKKQGVYDGDTTPLPLAVFKSGLNFLFNSILIAIKKGQMKKEALDALEKALKTINIEMGDIQIQAEEKRGVNTNELAALVSLVNNIKIQTTDKGVPLGPVPEVTKPENSFTKADDKLTGKKKSDDKELQTPNPDGTPPATTGEAPGGLDANAGEAAALNQDGKPVDAAAPNEPGAVATAVKAGLAAVKAGLTAAGNTIENTRVEIKNKLTGNTPEETAAKEAEKAAQKEAAKTHRLAAVEAGGGQGGGGNISRKRIHPQYINQVTENRNKIFKKELEIINSIRRFHRSHTIRKRDKINSILGLRKSRNNKNDANHKNTRRRLVQDRHNNYKHRTTKNVEK